MTKLRTTPNAWQAALAATSGDVRTWLETQGEVFPTCVNLNINSDAPLAAQAADALRAGTYGGRTKGAIQKIIDALTGTVVADAAPVTTVPPPVPVMDLGAIVGQLKSDEADKLQNMLQTAPPNAPPEILQAIQTKVAAVLAPVAEPAVAQVVEVSAEAAELDLILNPSRSIREAMAELAKTLRE